MRNMKIKMKFVQLKAEGLPMYMIAKEIGVHRTTLTMWNKQLAPYILIAKQDYMDEILLENNVSKLGRVLNISQELSSLYELLGDPERMIKAGAEYADVVNLLCKFTKLLHIELGQKHTEENLKPHNTNNIKELNEDISSEEAPLWIIDKEAFSTFQPEGDKETDTSDAILTEDTVEEDSMIAEYLRDITYEHPKTKQILEKTQRRQTIMSYMEEKEKPVKNSADKKKQKEEQKEKNKEEEKSAENITEEKTTKEQVAQEHVE